MGNGPAGKPGYCLGDLPCRYGGHFLAFFVHGYGCVSSGEIKLSGPQLSGLKLRGLKFLSPVIVFR